MRLDWTMFFRFGIFDGAGNPTHSVDLFDNWFNLTPTAIIKSTTMLTTATSDDEHVSYSQDLIWSKAKVLNSINDPEVLSKVHSCLAIHSKDEVTGPLALYYLFTTIASCSSDLLSRLSVRLMTACHLSNFPNEDLQEHARVWVNGIDFLGLHKCIPAHHLSTLIEVYENCSVPEFAQRDYHAQDDGVSQAQGYAHYHFHWDCHHEAPPSCQQVEAHYQARLQLSWLLN